MDMGLGERQRADGPEGGDLLCLQFVFWYALWLDLGQLVKLRRQTFGKVQSQDGSLGPFAILAKFNIVLA